LLFFLLCLFFCVGCFGVGDFSFSQANVRNVLLSNEVLASLDEKSEGGKDFF
jgi:hypothetical protein